MITLPKLRKRRTVDQALDEEMLRLLYEMEREPNQESDEYKAKMDILRKLKMIQTDGRPEVKTERLSPNTIAVIVGGLLQIVLIMEHERLHIFTTKAFSYILRGRV